MKIKPYLGFLICFPISLAILSIDRKGMPPWETWFDFLGMYWGMFCLVSFSYIVYLSVPTFVAGTINSTSLFRGFIGIAACVIFGTVFMYLTHSYGTPGQFEAMAYAVSYLALCLIYTSGYFARLLMKKPNRSGEPIR